MAWAFWAVATSDLMLWADAVVVAVALVVGFAPLVKWLPVVGPYVPAARIVALMGLFVMGTCVGHRLADESAELAKAKIDLAFTQLELDTQKRTAETAARLRADAEKKADEAGEKVSDYEAELAKRAANCGDALDGGDIGRLRGIAK